MARYSAAQIYAFALEAGFDRGSATTMTAIALAESGGRGSAHATHGEDSRGLWQINAGAHPDLAARYDLFDPRQNALAAFAVSGHGHDISPWTTTHGGARAAYLRHREAAQAAAVAHGEPAGLGVWSGTEGYGDHQDAGSAPVSGSAPGTAALDDNPFEVHAAALSGASASGENADNPFEAFLAAPVDVFEHAVPTVAEPTIGAGPTESFVDAALAQTGDRYVFGAQAGLNDPNPSAFDCAELVRWAGHRSGVDLPDGSWLQFLDLKRQGLVVPVQRGIDTRGALLFSFSTEPEPGAPRPSHAHVAISLGDGTTIEARGRAYGVGSFPANTSRFDYAALLPGTEATRSTGTTTSTDHAGTGQDGSGHGVSLADLDAGYAAALPVSLDTDTSPPHLAYPDDGHGLSTPAPADHGVVLGTDPFTVDSDPQQLTDSLELLFGDAGTALDGLAGDTTADPLGDAVHVALDTVTITPFDGFDALPDHASGLSGHSITTTADDAALSPTGQVGDVAHHDPGQHDAGQDPGQHGLDQHGLDQHGLDQHGLDQNSVTHSLDPFASDPGHDVGPATATDPGHV